MEPLAESLSGLREGIWLFEVRSGRGASRRRAQSAAGALDGVTAARLDTSTVLPHSHDYVVMTT